MAVPEMIKYRREFIGAFNVGVSLLADRFTSESMDMGRSVVFDVTAVGGRMQARSIDGRIPRTSVSDTQVTCTLNETVKKFEVTDFEAFTSQSDERAKMNHRIMESVNQELDYTILNELANASTTATGSGAAITLALFTSVMAELGVASVPNGPTDLTWIVSPHFEAKLLNLTAYTSADFVPTKPLETGGNAYGGQRKIRNFLGCGMIVHPNLPGAGTSSCTTYLVHRRALGVAAPTSQIKYSAGYDDQDHYHYCSATLKSAAKILQNSGIRKFVHTDA